MICPNCGATISDMFQHCPKCGATLRGGADETSAPQSAPQQQYPSQQPQYSTPQPQYSTPQPSYGGAPYRASPAPVTITDKSQLPYEYKPISAWGYFGWTLLFCIPFVGFILVIVFSCGASRNVNLKSYARSYLCWLIVLAAITTVLILIALIVGINYSSSFWFLDPRYW